MRANETTLLEMAVRRAGVFKGARAAGVVLSWALAVRELGHELGEDEGGHLTAAVREYSTYWKHTDRTGWRDVRRFKEVFGEDSPARLAAVVNAAADVRTVSRDELLAGLRLAV